jgi:CheY-like chemotaxis protein
VLLSDLAMPGRRGGYWLIGQVRALPPERGGVTPAAALTALTGPEHRASVLRAGFQLHVEKPVGLDALIGAVAILALKNYLQARSRPWPPCTSCRAFPPSRSRANDELIQAPAQPVEAGRGRPRR